MAVGKFKVCLQGGSACIQVKVGVSSSIEVNCGGGFVDIGVYQSGQARLMVRSHAEICFHCEDDRKDEEVASRGCLWRVEGCFSSLV